MIAQLTPGQTKSKSRKKAEVLKRKVLLVDDHPITRQGVSAMINQQDDLIVCGETDNAASALELISTLEPDMIVLDISLKTVNGIELAKDIKARFAKVPILMMSMHDEGLYAERSLRAGAKGYIMKQEANDKILIAINQVLKGDLYISDKIREKMLHHLVNKKVDNGKFCIDSLSDRELEVFRMMGEGFSTKEIASKLHLSPKTIESYREHLKTKLRLNSGAELVQYAIQWSKTADVAA
jgi:DNA-binding NarL/FixJ family response regulator